MDLPNMHAWIASNHQQHLPPFTVHTCAQGSPSHVPLVVAVGASKMPPQTRGVTKWSAPTKLRQALMRAIIRRSGGLEKERPVLLLPVNEYRTTLCCRWVGRRGAGSCVARIWY